MPQMAPMNWTIMFIIFILLYFCSTIIMYFTMKSPNLCFSEMNKISYSNKLNWKW